METENPLNEVDGTEPDDTTDQNGDGSVDEAEDAVAVEDTAESTDSESVSENSVTTEQSEDDLEEADSAPSGQRRHSSARSRRRNRGS